MTSHEGNTTRLAIRFRPGPWRLVIAAASLLISLIVMFNADGWIFACQRGEAQGGQCELTEMTGFRSHIERFNLRDLKKAEAAALPSKIGTDYAIFLHMTASDEVPTGVWGEIDYSNSGEQYQIAGQINAFLNDTYQQELIINRDQRLSSYAFATILISISLWIGVSTFHSRRKAN